MGRRGQLGLDGDLPWGKTYRQDLLWFRRMTEGHILIAGSKTAATLPEPLGFGRSLYVWHRGTDPEEMSAMLLHAAGGKDVFVVGGAATYKAFMPFIERFHIARLDYDGAADTWFPFDALANS